MIETVINYKPEFITDKNGRRVNFRYNEKIGEFTRDSNGRLYAQPWYMNFEMFGVNMQKLFQVHPVNLSVAV